MADSVYNTDPEFEALVEHLTREYLNAIDRSNVRTMMVKDLNEIRSEVVVTAASLAISHLVATAAKRRRIISESMTQTVINEVYDKLVDLANDIVTKYSMANG